MAKCQLTVVRDDCPNPPTLRIFFPDGDAAAAAALGCEECALRMQQISESFHEHLRVEPIEPTS